MKMPLKSFLTRFFVAVGVLFTFQFIAATVDSDFSLDAWYIFIAALIFAIIFTVTNRQRRKS